MTKIERIWVDPSFAKKLKGLAVEKDTSVVDLTKELGREDRVLEDTFFGKKKRGFGFNFP